MPVHLVPLWNRRILLHEMMDDRLREPRIVHLIALLMIFVFDLIDKVFPHQISIINIPLVHVPERFQVHNMLLVSHLESDNMMMDSGCRLEFLHIDFWYFRYDQESLEEWTYAQGIIYKLQS
nr:hypothetical protein [Tanacetum cinerariifolium]